MKKKNLKPLQLDKETIARLDEKQLESFSGGAYDTNKQTMKTDITPFSEYCTTFIRNKGEQ